ncbi:hypothetical protein ACL9RL_05910 [Plantibacter sp. Mn2098]|uniref:hypothetical protein n=1 Tax=Plantibacter sp. Mn2098 TaxID=3395266 RepID=UPI003BC69F4B
MAGNHLGNGVQSRPANDFDVRSFAKSAVGSRRALIDAAAFDDRPLAASSVRLLHYLADIERATMQYLRGVLVTPTHKDARVTAFLVTWAYEKYWIADTIDTILAADGQPVGETPQQRGISHTVRRLRERVSPIGHAVTANAIGEDVIAWHMTIGTVDELFTQAAYRTLLEPGAHPALVEHVEAILATKARHLEFFEAQARDRLARSPRARTITRRRIRSAAWPTGSAAAGREETAFFARTVFPGGTVWSDPAVLSIDDRIDALPGQAGLHLAAGVARRGPRHGATPIEAGAAR